MGLPLAKAKPISDSGSASEITYLRRGKKPTQNLHKSSWKSENMREQQLCRPQGQCRSRGGGAPGAGAEVPLQPMEQTMVRQAVTLQSMEVHGGADLYLQPMKDPMPEQVDAQSRL